MTANTDTLALTDDEAAAMALLASGAWRPPLPTIDGSSVPDVAAAVLRGRRSLVVRDLAGPDGTPAGEAAEVMKRLGTGPRAVFMLVDAYGSWVPRGCTVHLYGAAVDDLEMSHVVAPAGVHYFRVAPPPGQWRALTELAEAVFADGFAVAEDGDQQPAAALLQVLRADGIRGIRVARGTVTTARGPVPAPFPAVSPAVAWLLA